MRHGTTDRSATSAGTSSQREGGKGRVTPRQWRVRSAERVAGSGRVVTSSRIGSPQVAGSGPAVGSPPVPRPDQGQISLLILGFTVIALMLVLAGVDLTAAQLGRARLADAADSAALDAADELSEGAAYAQGLSDAITVSSDSVQRTAAAYLSAQPRPSGITSWALVPGTGSPDGATAVVRMTGTVDLPVSGMLRDMFGGSVSFTVESRARAVLQ